MPLLVLPTLRVMVLLPLLLCVPLLPIELELRLEWLLEVVLDRLLECDPPEELCELRDAEVERELWEGEE